MTRSLLNRTSLDGVMSCAFLDPSLAHPPSPRAVCGLRIDQAGVEGRIWDEWPDRGIWAALKMSDQAHYDGFEFLHCKYMFPLF